MVWKTVPLAGSSRRSLRLYKVFNVFTLVEEPSLKFIVDHVPRARVSRQSAPPPAATSDADGGSERNYKLDYLKVVVNLLVIFKHGNRGPVQRCTSCESDCWGGRSRGRFATPADCPLHDCIAPIDDYTHDAKVWAVFLVQGPFSVAPCPNRRFATS
jgi:hypothetical protein